MILFRVHFAHQGFDCVAERQARDGDHAYKIIRDEFPGASIQKIKACKGERQDAPSRRTLEDLREHFKR